MDSHEHWMRMCLSLAAQAHELGEAAVGCVIVHQGRTIAEATEQARLTLDPAGHAEILALKQACLSIGSLDLSGATLYSNVEPCFMCSHAIRDCGISQVYILEPVEGIGGITSHHPILTDSDLPYPYPPPTVVWLPKEGF